MSHSNTYWAVVPAAGVGKRMGHSIPKQYLPLLDKTVVEYALFPLLENPSIEKVVVSLSPDDGYWNELPVSKHPKVALAEGGAERCHSVLNGLLSISSRARADDWVLVHDAARPCLRSEDLNKLIDEVGNNDVGGILATPVHDTVKRSGPDQRITETVDRAGLWRAYTPQMFRYGLLKKALSKIISNAGVVTDEAAAMEAEGHMPRLVEGHGDNIKVTNPTDLTLAAFFLDIQHQNDGEET